jgi:hypothetical protein
MLDFLSIEAKNADIAPLWRLFLTKSDAKRYIQGL